MKTKPICRDAPAWVRLRLKDKRCFAPFTGQDWAAFGAWLHLVELYLMSDYPSRRHVVSAMRGVLCAMQPKCWPVAKAAIPAIGDWSHEAEIWGAINSAPGYAFLVERPS